METTKNGVKSFKRVETFKYKGNYYRIYVNKNDSVYKIEKTEISSWKEIIKGKKKVRIPDTYEVIPQPQLLNKISGNPYKIAIEKIITEIERESI